MPATSSSPALRRLDRRRHSAGFTLTELLIVVALIALLVGLLLAALGQVQEKSRKTATLATMESFKNACEAFRQDHGYYPGLVPEAVLISDAAANGGIARLSGTQNAILHMMGGAIREEDTPDDFDNVDVYPPEWDEVDPPFVGPGGTTYRIKINLAKIGDGPVINGKPYPPYLTPAEGELAEYPGLAGTPIEIPISPDTPDIKRLLPNLIDAWDQPIIYLRRLRSIGPLTAAGGTEQFHPASITPYTASEPDPADDTARNIPDQLTFSILPKGDGDSVALQNLDYVVGHPALADQARGAIVLISAGPDGVYFSSVDGPGDRPNPVTDLIGAPDGPYERRIIDEYDDVVVFGGS